MKTTSTGVRRGLSKGVGIVLIWAKVVRGVIGSRSLERDIVLV